MVNPFIKKKRNAFIGWSIGLWFLNTILFTTLLVIYPLILEATATPNLFAANICSSFTYLVESVITILTTFGLWFFLNSSAKKSGKPEATIPLTYAVVFIALLTIISYVIITPLNSIISHSTNVTSTQAILSLITGLLNIVLITVATIVVSKLLFKSDDSLISNIRKKVMTEKAAGNEVTYNPTLFSSNRIIVLAVFVIGFILNNVLSYFIGYACGDLLSAFLKAFLAIIFLAVYAVTVIITNGKLKNNNRHENTLPYAFMFIPFGTGIISNLTSYIYRFIANTAAYIKFKPDYYYTYTKEINEKAFTASNIITFITAIIFIVVFSILTFKHEDNRIKSMFDNGYFEKAEVIPQMYQAPVQPIYQQPVQPMYQQPVQPVYHQPVQPVYQQPVQPVYQQPVQPVYQQPVQHVYQQPVQHVQPVVVPEDKTAVADGNDENK